MLRALFSLVVLGVFAAVVFFVPLGGKTLAQHTSDVVDWKQVREKAKLVKAAIVAASDDKPLPPPAEKIEPRDRAELEALVRRAGRR